MINAVFVPLTGRNFNDVKAHEFFKTIIWNDVAECNGPVLHVPTLNEPGDTRYFEEIYTERTVSHQTLETTDENVLLDMEGKCRFSHISTLAYF